MDNTTTGPKRIGVSFSVKYSRELGINPQACLSAALKYLGITQLRLMSYWDLHEPAKNNYEFKELDWQYELAMKYDAKVSLAIGLRQPRWPESHWPQLASKLPRPQWESRLKLFIKEVVNRYKHHPCLDSWQLENEALLKTFGLNGDFSRQRLKDELALVKRHDTAHPIIMSLSDSWGLPVRRPRPDMFAISLYRRVYGNGQYHFSRRTPLFYKLRGLAIRLLTARPVFIHELQTEPWGPASTAKLTVTEQRITMTEKLLKDNVKFAETTGLLPAYLWGLEWWYWLKVIYNDNRLWQAAKEVFIEYK